MTPKTLCLTLPLVLLAAIACKKQDEPVATSGYQAGTPGAAGAAAIPSATPAATVAPPVTSAAAPAVTAPVAVDPTFAASLTKLASTQTVAGSKALGAPVFGTVGGTQVLEQSVTLLQNKCYSAVAVGMAPINELSVQLVTAPLGFAQILGIDQDVGPNATLGKKPNCITSHYPLPQPAKVVVSATSGQGLAGVQVFEK